MDKPLTVARVEFMQTIIDAVNNAQMPSFVKAEVLSQVLGVVREQAESQYQNDLKIYNESKEDK